MSDGRFQEEWTRQLYRLRNQLVHQEEHQGAAMVVRWLRGRNEVVTGNYDLLLEALENMDQNEQVPQAVEVFLSHTGKSVQGSLCVTPPTCACSLVDRLLPRADRKVILGDMEEEFKARLAKDGLTCARRWFWRETVWTIIQYNPIVRSALINGLMRFGEWIFRHIGG